MSQRTCLHCGEAFTTRRSRKFCPGCLDELSELGRVAYNTRYNQLMAFVRTGRHGPCCDRIRERPPRAECPVEPCSIPGCGRSRGGKYLMCHMHRERVKRTGSPGPPGEARRKNQVGHRYRQRGYVIVVVPDGTGFGPAGRLTFEHRLVMEAHLGRPLESWENVHHLNGVKDDNRIENLELWVRPQPSGQRARDLAEWVAATYPDLVMEVAREVSPLR